MDFFISNAYAQGAQQADPFGFLLPMLIIFGAFYFLLIRPQQKKQKAHTELVNNLEVGDEVLTAGGILGKITDVTDHYVAIEIGENTVIKMQKGSVSQVVPKGTINAA
ncbi:MAG: preprotein translocase subunit YajC [Woeseiaceae bacterium]|nr:preprotein translocase subunit YajC [Woeseiaceae bacterium]